jgi:hypothetical protein
MTAVTTPAVNSGSCTLQNAPCNTDTYGALEVGDCTNQSNGTYFDGYTFTGTAGDFVTATVRRRDSSYTNPLLYVKPPLQDASHTPIVWGNIASTLNYRLGTSGQWSYYVGTTDLFSHGSYILSTFCDQDSTPSVGQSCIYQDVLCGQTFGWNLTSQSCTFQGGQRLYQPIRIYGVAGDVLNIEMDSSDFRPLFGIYSDDGVLLASSQTVSASRQTMLFVVPSTGFYHVDATSQADQQVGAFAVHIDCSLSGCLWPLITQQPQGTSVPYGASALLSVQADAISPVTFELWEAPRIGLPFPVSSGSSPLFTTPPLTETTGFYVKAQNACGYDTSQTVTVVVRPPRRHAARH